CGAFAGGILIWLVALGSTLHRLTIRRGVCRAARKLPPTKKPITPTNNVQNSQRRPALDGPGRREAAGREGGGLEKARICGGHHTERTTWTVSWKLAARLRAGMMASRLNHRGQVIPALTDHLEDKGGLIGLAIETSVAGFFKIGT